MGDSDSIYSNSMEVVGEITEYNSILDLVEVHDHEHGLMNFWKVDPTIVSQLRSKIKVPVFFSFPDPFASEGSSTSDPERCR